MRQVDQVRVICGDQSLCGCLNTDASQPAIRKTTVACTFVTDFGRLEALSSEWTRLWKTDPQAEIFQTFEWSRAWWRSYGHHYKLSSFVVYEGAEVIGIIPMVMRRNIVQFLGSPEADYADIVCEDSRAVEVFTLALNTLLRSANGWRECALQSLSQTSRILRHYHELSPELRRHMHLVRSGQYQTIILEDQRDEVFRSILAKHHTRRRQNKLHKTGRVLFHHLETRGEAQQYISDFIRHHIRRHAVAARESSCGRPEFRQFLRNLIEELDPTSELRFGALELDGHPVAWHLGFHVNGKFLLYQHTFDVDVWDYTPGEVLLWNLLEYARNNVTREFDFGKGDESYKNRFANHARETFSLFIEHPSLIGYKRGLARVVKARLQRSISQIGRISKNHRRLFRAFRWIRAWGKGTWAGVRYARQNGTLLQYGLQAARDLTRSAVWSKGIVDVFVSIGVIQCNEKLPIAACYNNKVDVRRGLFGDLADLARERPDILGFGELDRCRERLKRGDRVYIAREGPHVVLVCWTSTSADPNSLNHPSDKHLSSAKPAIVMNECWTGSDSVNSASYALLLFVLANEAVRSKLDLVVQCPTDQTIFRRELKRQGFVPKCRIVQYTVFHQFHYNSVSLLDQNACPSSLVT